MNPTIDCVTEEYLVTECGPGCCSPVNGCNPDDSCNPDDDD